MKRILALSFFALVGCGKIDVVNDATLGNLRKLAPKTLVAGSTDLARITAICNSIDLKTQSIAAISNTQYSFSQTSKGCTESGFSNLADSTVTLVNSLSGFKFLEGANFFSFSEPELTGAGVLNEVCSTLKSQPSLQSPILIGQTNLIYFSIDTNQSDCANSADGNELCLMVEKAVRTTTQAGEFGKVHTRDWIRVRVNEPRRGFWTHRKVLSSASCDDDQTTGRTATLK